MSNANNSSIFLPSVSHVREGRGAVESMAECGLDYEVTRRHMTLENGHLVPDYRAMVHSATNEVLGVVGKDYAPVQNVELAELIDKAMDRRPEIQLVAAGPLKGGARATWWLRTGEFTLPGGDRNVNAVCLYTGHDGGCGVQLVPWSQRMVCKNQLRFDSAYTLRHTGDTSAKLDMLLMLLSRAEVQNQRWAATAERMVQTRLTQTEVRAFFVEAYERMSGKAIPSPEDKRNRRAYDRAINTVSDWMLLLQSPNQSLQGDGNTVWTCMNAVTEWVTHTAPVRVTGKSVSKVDARSSSLLEGRSSKSLTTVYKLASELVG